MRGDATDRDFCLEAARGASTIYHCMNQSENPPTFDHSGGV
jgi:hypothetical protein